MDVAEAGAEDVDLAVKAARKVSWALMHLPALRLGVRQQLSAQRMLAGVRC